MSSSALRADGVDILKAERHDAPEAERVRAELAALYVRLESIGVDYAEELLTGRQAKAATAVVNAKIARLDSPQHDSAKLRILNSIPLGTPEVGQAVKALSPDRFRALLGVLLTATVTPVGKGSHTFEPDRVRVVWK